MVPRRCRWGWQPHQRPRYLDHVINAIPLTVTVDDKSKIDGEANPTLTPTFAGLFFVQPLILVPDDGSIQ